MRHFIQAGLVLIGLSYTGTALAAMPKAMPLPNGISATAGSEGQCFKAGEKDAYLAAIPRVTVAGCSKKVVAPQQSLQAYSRAVSGNDGEVGHGTSNICEFTRRDHFSAYYLDVFLSELLAQIDSGSSAGAKCAAGMIHLWASNKAITKSDRSTASLARHQHATDMTRAWQLAGVSTAYFKSAATQSNLTTAQKNTVNKWLKTLAYDVQDRVVDGCSSGCGRGTNRQYWAAFSILPTGLLTRDAKLIKESERIYLAALSKITRDAKNSYNNGFLPAELKRGKKAQDYHVYALEPLLGMAVLSQAYDCDFTGSNWRREQISYLLRKTMEGRYNPQVFVDAMIKQEGKGTSQQTTSAAHLLFLANQTAPSIYNNVQSFMMTHEPEASTKNKLFLKTYGPTGKEVFGADYKGQDRMGGRFYTLVQRVKQLSGGSCPASIWRD